MEQKETVNHPTHYGGDTPHEHIKCTEAWGLGTRSPTSGYTLGQATKYIMRYKLKSEDNAVEDLEKAVWYLQHEIEKEKERIHNTKHTGGSHHGIDERVHS